MRPRSETRIQLCVSWANAPNKLRLQSRPKWLNGTPAKEGITGRRVMGFKQRWPDDCGRVTGNPEVGAGAARIWRGGGCAVCESQVFFSRSSPTTLWDP